MSIKVCIRVGAQDSVNLWTILQQYSCSQKYMMSFSKCDINYLTSSLFSSRPIMVKIFYITWFPLKFRKISLIWFVLKNSFSNFYLFSGSIFSKLFCMTRHPCLCIEYSTTFPSILSNMRSWYYNSEVVFYRIFYII